MSLISWCVFVLLRNLKMVDIVALKMPSENDVHVARSFLTKILRSSMRYASHAERLPLLVLPSRLASTCRHPALRFMSFLCLHQHVRLRHPVVHVSRCSRCAACSVLSFMLCVHLNGKIKSQIFFSLPCRLRKNRFKGYVSSAVLKTVTRSDLGVGLGGPKAYKINSIKGKVFCFFIIFKVECAAWHVSWFLRFQPQVNCDCHHDCLSLCGPA